MIKAKELKAGNKFAIRDVGTVEVQSVHRHFGFELVKIFYKRDDGLVFSTSINEHTELKLL
jgi:hypothetical protein